MTAQQPADSVTPTTPAYGPVTAPPEPPELLWYEQTAHRALTPAPGTTGEGSAPPAASGPGLVRRSAELVTVAVLAAVLASAGTYTLTRTEPAPGPVATTGSSAAPVLQADATAPNWSVVAGVVAPSVVAISVTGSAGSGQGSGVIFDTGGHILTNNHVASAGGTGSTLSVTLNDQRIYGATVVGTDPSTDLAVIKLSNAPKDLKAIALGDANTLKVGEQVMAVGNPLGLAGTVTTGIVSALNRPVSTTDPQGNPLSAATSEPVVTNAIQTSAAINPGNSGGALVNASGQLVGINSAIASLGSMAGSPTQSGNIGIGFAIPVGEAKSIAGQLIASGKATHPYLGVKSSDYVVADGFARRTAAVLTSVMAGTPAAKSGLRVGDAIIAAGGNSIDGSLSLVAQIREHAVGDKVILQILRGGQRTNVTVTLAARPAATP